eukprot:SAG31_NODE_7827_length_1588_cov_1.549362_2_plen_300_part_01
MRFQVVTPELCLRFLGSLQTWRNGDERGCPWPVSPTATGGGQAEGHLANVTASSLALVYEWPESAVIKTDDDSRLSLSCSLSGTLDVSTGRCRCMEGWRGPVCSTLDLVPISSSTAIEEVVAWAPNGRNSWGGSVVRDRSATPQVSKPYHMFAAVMQNNLSLAAGWEANSTIEHLVAASPAGPFEPATPVDPIVKPHEAHNPSVAWDPKTEQYCLYYIGRSPIDGPPVTPAYWTGIADIAVTCSKTLSSWDGVDGPFPLVPHQITPTRWDNWIQVWQALCRLKFIWTNCVSIVSVHFTQC